MDSPQLRRLTAICLAMLVMVVPTRGAAQAEIAQSAPRRTLVVLIGGMDSDPTPAQIAGTAARNAGNSGLYRLRSDLQRPQIVTEYFNWNGTRASQINSQPPPQARVIVDTIRKHVRHHPQDRVVLVGNSWGGHTTYEVCQQLVDSPTPVAIDYAVFLDPSSTGRAESARPKKLPININRATNFHTRNLFGWGKLPKDERIENIDLGDARHGFQTPDGPAYNSTFDFNAHVAAEWDERIHAAIRTRITNLAVPPVFQTATGAP